MKKLLVLIPLAALAALFPYPPAWIERWYSGGVYPHWQRTVTPLTNLAPIAVLDVAAALALLAAIAAFVRLIRTSGVRTAAGRALVWSLTILATVYLLFVVTWGLNYHRIPLDAKLDYDATRITPAAATRLATLAIQRLNAGHASAHARPLRDEALTSALFDTLRLLGSPRWIEPARPKRSVLQLYFRQAAINGMTVPGFLEVILNPDLLDVEIPSTLAHEWAHLAGYAGESEANFVSWLACIRSGDPLAQYSGWLDAYGHAVRVLPRSARASLPRLEEGPRHDLRAIAARYERSSPRLREVARSAYDSYLKANRVDEGIRDYGAVLELMLGTRFEEGWTPVVRRER